MLLIRKVSKLQHCVPPFIQIVLSFSRPRFLRPFSYPILNGHWEKRSSHWDWEARVRYFSYPADFRARNWNLSKNNTLFWEVQGSSLLLVQIHWRICADPQNQIVLPLLLHRSLQSISDFSSKWTFGLYKLLQKSQRWQMPQHIIEWLWWMTYSLEQASFW